MVATGAAGGIETAIYARFAREDAQTIDLNPATPKPSDAVTTLVTWLAASWARCASARLWVLDGGLITRVRQMQHHGFPR